MFLHRQHRDMPGLNTTSTADISFMLLVFFLVTSSMNTDRGLGRKLSPDNDRQQEQRDINRGNVLQVRIDAADRLYCDGQPVTPAELTAQVESFVASRQTDRHVIAVETARESSYNAYFEMQDAIVAAYSQIRDKTARQEYGRAFALCTDAQRKRITDRYPQRISEGVMEQEPAAALRKGGGL